MRQNLRNDLRLLDVDAEHTPQALSPAHRHVPRGCRRVGNAGLISALPLASLAPW